VPSSELPPAEGLLPLVYEELRRLAAHKMAHEAPGQTLLFRNEVFREVGG